MSESHNLAAEFPEFKGTIHNLKGTNAHFKKLFDRYQEVDRAVVRAEQRIDLMSELDEENLRKERLHLKEEIYLILKAESVR